MLRASRRWDRASGRMSRPGPVADDRATERAEETDMEMYVFHYPVFVLQLLVGLVVALVAVELYRLNTPGPRQRYRRNPRHLSR